MKLQRLFTLFLMGTFVCSTVRAQDLGDELNAIDDAPEAGTATPGESAKGGGEEDLPEDETLDQELNAKKSAPSDELGNDDLSLDDSGVEASKKEELPEDELSNGGDEGATGLEDELKAIDKGTPAQATTGIELGETSKVFSLNFRQLNDRVRAVVRGSGAIDFSREIRSQRKQVIVELKNAFLARSVLKRAIDTGEFEGPVALIQAYDSTSGSIPSVKVLFQLRKMQDFKITRSGNDLYIDFPLGGDGTLFRSGAAAKTPSVPETFLTLDSKSRFTGKKMSINVRDVDLQAVLKKISIETGVSFVFAGGTTGGKVSLNLSNAPWDQVLAIVLANLKLGYQKIGKVYRIAPQADLKTEIEDAAKIVAESEKLIPLETRLIPINYARATDVSANIKDFLTARGKISVDARTNSLVVTDTPDVLDKVVTYARSVDKQTALVQIEARIVEAKETFSREINQRLLLGPVESSSFGKGSFVSVGPNDDPTTIVNGLRVRTGLGSLGAIDAFLKFSEAEGNSKTIASPRVTVLDNKKAIIENGDVRNIVTTDGQTGLATTASIRQTLKLEVTPQVTSDGFVLVDASLHRDTPSKNGDSRLDVSTRSAQTQMLIESGKTAMIGGIYTIDKGSSEAGWPFLRSLPIFGALFKNNMKTDSETTELLMFISPKIINANRAYLSYKDDLKNQGGDSARSAEAEDVNLDSNSGSL